MTNMRPPNKSILLKVIILGDGGVGKSCLMNRFISNRYDENNFHTIGVEFMNRDIEIDGEKYTLQIWDTAGQERFRALRTPFYRGSDVCLLCYAIDDVNSFCGLKQWREEFLHYADVNAEKFPFIVVGNKNDIEESRRKVTTAEVQSWCDSLNIKSNIETSSKTASNVVEAFVLAVRQWKQMERMAEIELREENTIHLSKKVRLVHNRLCCAGSTSSVAGGSSRGMGGDYDYGTESEDELPPQDSTSRRGFMSRSLKYQECNPPTYRL